MLRPGTAPVKILYMLPASAARKVINERGSAVEDVVERPVSTESSLEESPPMPKKAIVRRRRAPSPPTILSVEHLAAGQGLLRASADTQAIIGEFAPGFLLG